MPKDLARGIAAVAVLAIFAMGAAFAWGGNPKKFYADFEERGFIEFYLSDDRSRVKDIYFAGVQITCGEDTAQIEFTVAGSTPVRDDRSFAVRSVDEKPGGTGEALVKGRFSRKFKRAEGTVRVQGDFKIQDQWYRACKSGKQRFVAK